jgi:tetratricopeptide (TPR) repeat protein
MNAGSKLLYIKLDGCNNVQMKTLLLTLIVAASAHAVEQKPEFKYDPNSPDALAAKGKYEGYERDGQALQTYDLFKELGRLDAAKKSRIALAIATKPEEIMAATFSTTDDDMRAISYATVLQKRSEGGDPYASFYNGVRQWDFCSQLQRQTGDVWTKQAPECWQNVMSAFKRASNAQIADATFNIARLYENGFGVTPSKLAAAEWYVKSANQYNKEKSREEALTAVESALNLVPDHPAALRLRKAMLK